MTQIAAQLYTIREFTKTPDSFARQHGEDPADRLPGRCRYHRSAISRCRCQAHLR